MVSEASSLPTSLVSAVPGSATAPAGKVQDLGGSGLPPSGKTTAVAAPAPAASSAVRSTVDTNNAGSIVSFLNKYLNDSGRPDQFRVDPSSGGKFIQQINPASGVVVAEYAIAEFPALARGIGASGLLVDGVA